MIFETSMSHPPAQRHAGDRNVEGPAMLFALVTAVQTCAREASDFGTAVRSGDRATAE